MKIINWRYWVGGLLVAMGIISLLSALQIINLSGSLTGLFFGALFALGGLIFLSVLFNQPEHWWAAIPGIILLSLGLMMVFDNFWPGFDRFSGSFFLAGIALAFVVVLLRRPDFWWAVIPAGTLLTLAVVAGLDSSSGAIAEVDSGGVLFLGLGVTFGVLALLKPGGESLRWAWFPAVVLLVMGLLISLSGLNANMVNYVWPLALIGGGIWLLARSLLRK